MTALPWPSGLKWQVHRLRPQTPEHIPSSQTSRLTQRSLQTLQATVEINQFGEVGPRPRPRVWSAHCAVRSGRGPSGTAASRRPGTRRTWPGRAAAGTEPRGRRLGDPRHRPPSSVAVHISEMTTPRNVWSRSSEGDSATRAPTLRASRVFKRRPVPQGASGHCAATPRLSAGAGRRRASVPSPRGAPALCSSFAPSPCASPRREARTGTWQ